MKNQVLPVSPLLTCQDDQSAYSSSTTPKMLVRERLKKARAVKAAKRHDSPSSPKKATAANYKLLLVKVPQEFNGEVVHIGEQGAKFYINRNGHKTYLSSNQ